MRMQGRIQGKPPTAKASQKSVVKDLSNTQCIRNTFSIRKKPNCPNNLWIWSRNVKVTELICCQHYKTFLYEILSSFLMQLVIHIILKLYIPKSFTTISVIGLLKLKKQKHNFVEIADILSSSYEYSKGAGIFFLIGTYSMQD